MSGGIFISYRRDDTRQAAGRLADDLVAAFGRERIFRDIETIEIGVDFTQALEKALAECEVMLVLIGRAWAGITDAAGLRRLTKDDDWIRAEIVTALQRGIRVVPVLVDGAELPAASELPEDLQPLLRRQALELADARWASDVVRLVEGLRALPGLAPKTPAATPSALAQRQGASKVWLVAAAAVVVLGGGFAAQQFGWMLGSGNAAVAPEAPEPQHMVFVSGDDAMTFTPWDSDKPKVEVEDRSLQPQARVVQSGEATWDEVSRTFSVTLNAATEEDFAAKCELLLSKDEKKLTGTCSADTGEPYEFNGTAEL